MDKSGTLSYEEVEGVFATCSPVALPPGLDIMSVVKRIDADADGQISINEFLEGLTAAWVKAASAVVP